MIFDREKLLAALVAVRPGITKKDVVAQATAFIFDDNLIFSYNDNVGVIYPYEHDLSCAVNGDLLYNLLVKAKDKEISFELIEEDVKSEVQGASENSLTKYWARIKGKRFSTDISAALPQVDRSKFAPAADAVWHPIPKDFSKIVELTTLTVSTDLSRPALTCVHWTPQFIESCDNYRLTRFVIDETAPEEEGVLIPASSFYQLNNYEITEYTFGTIWAYFRTKLGSIFLCHVFEGKYNNISAILNMKEGVSFTFPLGTVEMLQRAAVVSKAAISGAEQAELSFAGKELVITASSQAAKFFERLPLRVEINAKFHVRIAALLHILAHFSNATIADSKDRLRFVADNMTHVVALLSE